MWEGVGRVGKRKGMNIRGEGDFNDVRETIRVSLDGNSFMSLLQKHKFISQENPGRYVIQF